MRLRGFLLLNVILFQISFFVSAHQNVRIRLFKSQPKVFIEGQSVSVVSNDSEVYFSKISSVRPLYIDFQSGTYGLSFTNYTERERLWNSQIEIKGFNLRVNGQSVPNKIELIYTYGKVFDIISTLSLEDYLQVVVPSEVPSRWPLEALKAQAIASRTYTLSVLKERSHLHYDVESTVEDQVFNLDKRLKVRGRHEKNILKALQETKGVHLSYLQRPLKAFYHSNCGGQTEIPKYVWGVKKGFTSVKDRYCQHKSSSNWRATVKWSELSERLSQMFPVKGKIVAAEVAEKSPSGRVLTLSFRTESGEVYKLLSQEFRRLLGFFRIKSTFFSMVVKQESLVLKGKGFGHGVGMCQWGARRMAIMGHNHKDILRHYYPKARIDGEPLTLMNEELTAKRNKDSSHKKEDRNNRHKI